jgi:hypothetical protein
MSCRPACDVQGLPEEGIAAVTLIISPIGRGRRRGRVRVDELATPRSGASRPPRGPGELAHANAHSLVNRGVVFSPMHFSYGYVAVGSTPQLQQTVNDVLGLICQGCLRPFTIGVGCLVLRCRVLSAIAAGCWATIAAGCFGTIAAGCWALSLQGAGHYRCRVLWALSL